MLLVGNCLPVSQMLTKVREVRNCRWWWANDGEASTVERTECGRVAPGVSGAPEWVGGRVAPGGESRPQVGARVASPSGGSELPPPSRGEWHPRVGASRARRRIVIHDRRRRRLCERLIITPR